MTMHTTVSADRILFNGEIWCGYNEGVVQAIAIWDGKILATGSNEDILQLKGAKTEAIDLQGAFATPGLNDAHLHLISTGLSLKWIDATPANLPTLDSLLDAIRQKAAELPKGEWIYARGYDQTKLDIGRHPHRTELDQAAPDHPVMLTRTCGHVSIFNSLAFQLAEVDSTTAQPSGGLIEKSNGSLTGMVAENAQEVLRAAQPVPSQKQMIEAIEDAGNMLLSFGITSVMDAAVGMVAGMSEILAYQTAKLQDRMPVRSWLVLLGDPGRSIVEECYNAGYISGAGDNMLTIGAVKVFLDGSAGGKTAWMSKPYLNDEDNYGIQILTDEELQTEVSKYHKLGYQLACHAIGDMAIEQLITAYEKALSEDPDPDRRHRIEHCGFSTEAQHERMQKAGIYPCPQQTFIYDFGDAYISVMGKERSQSSYPLNTWCKLGFKPATSSDSPVCHPNPFPNIYNMITRKTWKGTVMDENERVSIEEALRVYTEYGAFSQKQENIKGKLVPGQVADIAVFSRNLLTAEPEDILHNTQCNIALRDGKVVFQRH